MSLDNFLKNKKVLLTGNTGFKGTWLNLMLLNLGADVYGLSLPLEKDPFLFFEQSGLQNHPQMKDRQFYADITDRSRVDEIIQKIQPEIILHLAAQSLVRRSYEEPSWTFEANLMGTVNILDAARRSKVVRKIIVVTSDKCYDNKEWIWGYRECDPLGGFDPYSASKACAELATQSFRNSYGSESFAIASARAGNVFGGGDWAKDRIIPDIMRAFITGKSLDVRNPNAQRPWQFVLEALSGYLLLLRHMYENPIKFSEAWNFGPHDEDAVTVRELVLKVQKNLASLGSTKLHVEYAEDQTKSLHEAHFLKLDTSKARTTLGWTPTLGLDEGLSLTTKWYECSRVNPHGLASATQEQIHNYLSLMKQRFRF